MATLLPEYASLLEKLTSYVNPTAKGILADGIARAHQQVYADSKLEGARGTVFDQQVHSLVEGLVAIAEEHELVIGAEAATRVLREFRTGLVERVKALETVNVTSCKAIYTERAKVYEFEPPESE